MPKVSTSGTAITVSDVFVPGDIVDVTGISKGKGFAGGVKRWGFKGGPRTHGQSDRERAPGSLGQTTTPGRVYKGKKMAGRMGQETVTVKNLEVIEVTADGMLLIKGLVPGSLNSIVVVKKMGTNKKFVPLYREIVEEPVIEPAVEETAEAVTEVESEAPASVGATEAVVEVQSETPAAEEKPAEDIQAPSVQNEEVKAEIEEVKENASS